MRNLQVFKNSEFGEVRTVLENGKILFCGADVARALGYDQPHKAIERHCRYSTKRTIPHPQSTSKQIEMLFITEGDLYRLVVGSKLESAEKFEKWVFDEVLPSIRKNGGYINNQENMTPEQVVANALLVAQNIIDNQKRQLTEQKPLVDFANQVTNAENAISIGEFAKVLQGKDIKIGQNKLFQWLRECKYVDKNNIPYQRYLPYFKVIEQTYTTKNGTMVTTKTLISGKGQIYFADKLRERV